MVEGSGHVPIGPDRVTQKQDGGVQRAPSMCWDPLVTDIAPGYDHITSALARRWRAWHGTAMLCYVTPRTHWGLPNRRRRARGPDRLQEIAAQAADLARHRPATRDARRTNSAGAATLSTGTSSSISRIDPRTRREIPRETLPADIYKRSRIPAQCCGPSTARADQITDEDAWPDWKTC